MWKYLSLLTVSAALAACGGTTEETIDYESSNGTILWSKYGHLPLPFLINESYFYSAEYENRIDNRGEMELYRIWLDGTVDFSHTFPGQDVTGRRFVTGAGGPDESFIVARNLYVAENEPYQLTVDSVSAQDFSIHSFSRSLDGVSNRASVTGASGKAGEESIRLQSTGEEWWVDRDGISYAEIPPVESTPSYQHETPDISVDAEYFKRIGGGQGLGIVGDFFITTFDPYERESVTTFITAYDPSTREIVWQTELGRQPQAPSGGLYVTDDLIIVTTMNDDVDDGCSATAYTYSRSGLGAPVRIDCGPGRLYETTGLRYLTLDTSVSSSGAFIVRRFDIDNRLDAEHVHTFDEEWDSMFINQFDQLEDGKLLFHIRTYRSNLSLSSPWLADIDSLHREHVLVLNPDLSLYARINTVSFRTVKRERLFLPGFYVLMEESTPAWRFEKVHLTSGGDILFEGEFSPQDGSYDDFTRFGVLH